MPSPRSVTRRLALGAGLTAALAGAGVIAYPFLWLEGVQNTLTADTQQDAAAVQQWAPAQTMQIQVAPAENTDFATLHVPRFGADYARIIREGVDEDTVLDPGRIGHYPGTAMPGGVGNFSIAGHRNISGAPLRDIDQLVPGDPIYVHSDAGWFTYRHESSQTLPPTAVDAIAPVPYQPGEQPELAFLTLQSCTGWRSTERILALARFTAWSAVDPR